MERDEYLQQWIQAYADRMTQLAFSYVRDWSAAEDVAQEAFVKAYRSMHQLHDLQKPLPWLMRIVINECRNLQRKSWREVVTTLLPVLKSKSSEETYLHAVDKQEVHAAILALPETFRLPIILYYFEELSTQEIAEVLQLKAATVRTRLARGRERLEKQLKRGGVGEHRGAHSRSETTV